ncbi:MAG: hypothetical protein R2784_13005 [Saprospiraceae bacterium]
MQSCHLLGQAQKAELDAFYNQAADIQDNQQWDKAIEVYNQLLDLIL